MRLFVAIELSEEVRATLVEVQSGLRRWSKTVRWVDPSQLHLTVKFLGEAAESTESAIRTGLDRCAASSSAFDLTLTHAGCFPPRGPVRIVWVGAEEPSGALESVVGAVETETERLGFAREPRPFSPHLTVGRVREDSSAGKLRGEVVGGVVRAVSQSVESLTLMSSTLSAKGSSYSVVHRSAFASNRG